MVSWFIFNKGFESKIVDNAMKHADKTRETQPLHFHHKGAPCNVLCGSIVPKQKRPF